MTAVPNFCDISDSEQTLQLKAYLRDQGAVIKDESSISGQSVDLVHIIDASDVVWKETSDEDVESIFNSVISLILLQSSNNIDMLTGSFCDKLVKGTGGSSKQSIKMRLLMNIRCGLGDMYPKAHFNVVQGQLQLAKGAGKEAWGILQHDLPDRKQLEGWNVSLEEIQQFLRLHHECARENGDSEEATKVMIELLGTYTVDRASEAREDAIRCIVTCMKDPKTYLFDNLLMLKPVKFLEGELIHNLLSIFVNGTLEDYLNFYQKNKEFVLNIGLNHEQNVKKLQLLTFLSMGCNVTEVEFSKIEKELHMKPEDVEEFIIDVVSSRMMRCRIDHTLGKVIVHSSTTRTFSKHHWQVVRDTLASWDTNLTHLVQMMNAIPAMAGQMQ